jgi:branched-chain amino acid transport system ATP-binding protein
MSNLASVQTLDLGIRFGGHAAVDAVSCAFYPGTLTAIVGPNGAGKTTFFNLISGQLRPSCGRVLVGSRDVTALSASARARLGLGRAFQLTQLFARLSVLENVRLAIQARTGLGLDLWSIASRRRALIEQAHALLERTGLAARCNDAAATLPHGDQRKLEVAILLAMQPRVFMFDEPTAGMSVDEVPAVLELISAIRQQRTATVLLVEHKMEVVRALADRIMVLHNGRCVADGAPQAVMDSPVVRQAYLGLAEAKPQP